MDLKEQDIKQLVDKNFMFLIMLGYVSAILYELENIIEISNKSIPVRTVDQIEWFKEAIENIVYKDIPAPKMP
jgi:hypothetical protein